MSNQKSIQTIVGENVRKARKERNLTQDQLSANSKIEKAMLSRIENGKANPTIGTLARFAQALEVPVIYFFNAE